MNLKRFTARTTRDALALVRQAFGDEAVVMSTRPCPEGVEVLAMAPESLQQLERVTMPGMAAPSGTGSAAGSARNASITGTEDRFAARAARAVGRAKNRGRTR